MPEVRHHHYIAGCNNAGHGAGATHARYDHAASNGTRSDFRSVNAAFAVSHLAAGWRSAIDAADCGRLSTAAGSLVRATCVTAVATRSRANTGAPCAHFAAAPPATRAAAHWRKSLEPDGQPAGCDDRRSITTNRLIRR